MHIQNHILNIRCITGTKHFFYAASRRLSLVSIGIWLTFIPIRVIKNSLILLLCELLCSLFLLFLRFLLFCYFPLHSSASICLASKKKFAFTLKRHAFHVATMILSHTPQRVAPQCFVSIKPKVSK